MRDVFAILVGGLGGDQTGTIRQSLEQLPGVRVVSAGNRDGYKRDLLPLVQIYPAHRIVLILHSFALRPGLELCEYLADRNLRVDCLVILDGVVDEPLWAEEIEFPTGEAAPLICDIWRAAISFPVFPARISGGPEPVFVDGTDHNTLCHHPGVVGRITERVRSLAPLTPTSQATPAVPASD